MMHPSTVVRRSRALLLSRLTLGALLVAPVLAGCDLDELLEVEDEFTVTPAVAGDTLFLENTFGGAKAQFGVAVGGVQNNFMGLVQHTGLASDELYAADNFSSRYNIDLRDFDYELPNTETDESFRWLQRARVEALNAAGLFAGTSQKGSGPHGELYNIAAYSTLMLAENFCSGVPLSRVGLNGEIEYSGQLTTNEVYDRAIAYFDSAMTIASGNARQVNVARIGKARALLDKGEFAQAGSVAAQVPDGFEDYVVEFSGVSQRAWNAVYQFNYDEKRLSASIQEGTLNKGLPYNVDPRTPINPVSITSNAGGTVRVFLQEAYESYDADIPLATAYEARYIQAEAALAADQVSQFETLLNRARAIQGLPALTSAEIGSTKAQRVDTLFRERAYAMWLTGHRFSDLRRLVRQYGRPYGSVFPTGTSMNVTGLPYETGASFPIPTEEANNPEVKYGAGLGVCLSTGA